MRGFFVGSLALIVIYTVVQKGASDKISSGGGALIGLARRALSPSVAGVPDRAGHQVVGSGIGQATPPGVGGQSGLGKAGNAGGGGGGGGGGSF